MTRVTRPSTVDKPNREARSKGPTQAPPLMNARCFACKGCYITSRKGYSTSGPGKVTIHRPGLSPLPPMNVRRLITIAAIVSRAILAHTGQFLSCFSTFLSRMVIFPTLIQHAPPIFKIRWGFLARTCASSIMSYITGVMLRHVACLFVLSCSHDVAPVSNWFCGPV